MGHSCPPHPPPPPPPPPPTKIAIALSWLNIAIFVQVLGGDCLPPPSMAHGTLWLVSVICNLSNVLVNSWRNSLTGAQSQNICMLYTPSERVHLVWYALTWKISCSFISELSYKELVSQYKNSQATMGGRTCLHMLVNHCILLACLLKYQLGIRVDSLSLALGASLPRASSYSSMQRFWLTLSIGQL